VGASAARGSGGMKVGGLDALPALDQARTIAAGPRDGPPPLAFAFGPASRSAARWLDRARWRRDAGRARQLAGGLVSRRPADAGRPAQRGQLGRLGRSIDRQLLDLGGGRLRHRRLEAHAMKPRVEFALLLALLLFLMLAPLLT